MNNVEHTLSRETEAARDLLRALRQLDAADDAELVADAIEGETGLNEAIAAALDEVDECELIEAGCKAKSEQFDSRAAAAAARKDRVRASIERAMVLTDQYSLRLPAATLSIAKRKPQPVIDDEAAIPSRFFVQPEAPPPKLDKKALAAALAEEGAEPIPGAHLDNGSISLTIRRR